MHPSTGPERKPSALTWESFGMAAFWRLVALLALLVVVLGVLTASWDVALGTARVALVVLLLVATWLYGVWFVRQRAELNRRDELERPPVPDYRPR